MNILALDTATRTGWAVWKASGPRGPESFSGVADFTPPRSKNDERFLNERDGQRFYNFRNWLLQMINAHDIQLLTYEAVVGGGAAGGHTSLIQKGLEALVLEAATHKRFQAGSLPVWSFSAATIKKWAIGTGRLTHESKIAMVREAYRQFRLQQWVAHNATKGEPWDWDDNQADALWLLDLTRAVLPFLDAEDALLHFTPAALTRQANIVTETKWQK